MECAYAYTSTKVLGNATLMCTGPYLIPNVKVDPTLSIPIIFRMARFEVSEALRAPSLLRTR
jgi:hypothetical protein